MEERYKPLIGVIGGVGPYAGLDFVRNIFSNTRALKDQEHLNTLLVSCPSIIPDRTKYLLDEEPVNPSGGLFESAKILYAAGARHAVVACNTAHSDRIFAPFCGMVKEAMPDMVIVNMLRACVDFIKKKHPEIKTLGLLATRGTYKSRVYGDYFKAAEGFSIIEPEPPGQDRIGQAIYSLDFGIKAHSNPVKAKACNILLYEGFRLLDRGARGLILGCTELPLAMDQEDFSAPVFNPGFLAARELIRLTAPSSLTEV
ncbi:MAG: amino acid racemase [Spirochaetaceae bacterium]|nr:amino acid racemase [Spirochaetaceae bacterium]